LEKKFIYHFAQFAKFADGKKKAVRRHWTSSFFVVVPAGVVMRRR
jgi:hypothetical protein